MQMYALDSGHCMDAKLVADGREKKERLCKIFLVSDLET